MIHVLPSRITLIHLLDLIAGNVGYHNQKYYYIDYVWRWHAQQAFFIPFMLQNHRAVNVTINVNLLLKFRLSVDALCPSESCYGHGWLSLTVGHFPSATAAGTRFQTGLVFANTDIRLITLICTYHWGVRRCPVLTEELVNLKRWGPVYSEFSSE